MGSFLAFLIQGIPIIGKGIEAWTAHDQKKQDVALEKYKTDGVLDIEKMKADLQLLQMQKELRIAEKGDPVVKVGMGLFIVPSGVWFAAGMWDSTFRNLIPSLTWRTLELPQEMYWVLSVVVGYLFLTTIKQVWRK